MLHPEPHPLAGQTVKVDLKAPNGVVEYRVEDYWDRVAGQSWMDSTGNPAALAYAMRAGVTGLPIDNNVPYGKVGHFGHLVHVSELVTEA